MANQLNARFCPKCGGKLDEIVGTQTSCPYCGHNLKTQFEDPEMAQLSSELDIGLEGLKGLKANRNKAARDAWDLEKEKLLFHEQHGTKECGKCGTINFEQAKFCMECAVPFTMAVKEAPIPFSEKPRVIILKGVTPMKTCNQCGALFKLEAIFCPECGHKQPA